MGAGRSDRSILKRMPASERKEAETLLASGEWTGKRVTKKFKWPSPLWASAVKKNPLPGGPLDPKGAVARHVGEWVDEGGLVRPWAGFRSDGRPKLYAPKGRGKKGKNVVPFKPTAVPPPLPTPPPLPPAAMPSVPTDTVLDDLLPPGQETENTKRKPRLDQLRKKARKLLPVERRLELMAGLLQPRVVMVKDVPVTVQPDSKDIIAVVAYFDKVDGTEKELKETTPEPRGSAPLFALPAGGPAVGMAPVGSVPTREEQYPDEVSDVPPPPAAETSEGQAEDGEQDHHHEEP